MSQNGGHAAEQDAEDLRKFVPQRFDLPRSHHQCESYADEPQYEGGEACRAQQRAAVACRGAEFAVNVRDESRCGGVHAAAER